MIGFWMATARFWGQLRRGDGTQTSTWAASRRHSTPWLLECVIGQAFDGRFAGFCHVVVNWWLFQCFVGVRGALFHWPPAQHNFRDWWMRIGKECTESTSNGAWIVAGIDWYASATYLVLTWGAFEPYRAWNYPEFCVRVGIFADMWIDFEDSRPIAVVFCHLFSVLIYVNDLPKSFMDLLLFFCARGSRECSWRSMGKIFGFGSRWQWGQIGQKTTQ